MVIRRVDAVSCAKIAGLLYAILGLIVGAIASLFAVAGGLLGASSLGGRSALLGTLFGVGAVIFFPLFYGAIGFVSSLIAAWIYNFLAGIVGGIRIEVEALQPVPGAVHFQTPTQY